MGHQLRIDVPGAIYHVVNRGLARRPLFENESDRRLFLSFTARAVRSGWIRVHAYSLMTNHFHLLVTSEGHLSTYMQWAMSQFVRRFNRRRERDGGLFRGRFKARRVLDEDDFRNVVRYIDNNPVAAGVTTNATKYRAGSAWHYTHRRRHPLWLHRQVVEGLVASLAARPTFDPSDYLRVLGSPSPAVRWCVERRVEVSDIDTTKTEADPQPIAWSAGSRLDDWRQREANADGPTRRPPLVAPVSVLDAIASRCGPSRRSRSRTIDLWDAMSCGLLRVACGLSFREISRYANTSLMAVCTRCDRHTQQMHLDPHYRKVASEVIAAALDQDECV